jgi:hypothetical protein
VSVLRSAWRRAGCLTLSSSFYRLIIVYGNENRLTRGSESFGVVLFTTAAASTSTSKQVAWLFARSMYACCRYGPVVYVQHGSTVNHSILIVSYIVADTVDSCLSLVVVVVVSTHSTVMR